MDLINDLLSQSELLTAIIIVALALYVGKIINEKILSGKLSAFIVAMVIALLVAGIAGFSLKVAKVWPALQVSPDLHFLEAQCSGTGA